MRAVGSDVVRSALAAASGVGGYFATSAPADRDDWTRVADLIADHDGLRDGAVAAADRLGAANPDPALLRACGSLALLGTAARLVSPVLGAAVLAGVVPVATPSTLLWAPPRAGELAGLAWVGRDGHAVAHAEQAADVITTGLVREVLLPLAEAHEVALGLPSTITRGNLASALAGAATVLAGERVLDPTAIVRRCVDRGPLAGTGDYSRSVDTSTLLFRRRSCCLYYRLPGGGLCGDCVLRPA